MGGRSTVREVILEVGRGAALVLVSVTCPLARGIGEYLIFVLFLVSCWLDFCVGLCMAPASLCPAMLQVL